MSNLGYPSNIRITESFSSSTKNVSVNRHVTWSHSTGSVQIWKSKQCRSSNGGKPNRHFLSKILGRWQGGERSEKKEPLVENLQECMVRKLIFLLFSFIFRRLLHRRRNFLSLYQNFVFTKAPSAISLILLMLLLACVPNITKESPRVKLTFVKTVRPAIPKSSSKNFLFSSVKNLVQVIVRKSCAGCTKL